MPATIIITAATKSEEQKKTKALQYMASNLTLIEIQRLEEMSRNPKARAMLTENWEFLRTML